MLGVRVCKVFCDWYSYVDGILYDVIYFEKVT
jgi:hypothetical protein